MRAKLAGLEEVMLEDWPHVDERDAIQNRPNKGI
jgi:hypothetical protein